MRLNISLAFAAPLAIVLFILDRSAFASLNSLSRISTNTASVLVLILIMSFFPSN